MSVSFGTLDAPIEVKKDGVILSSSDYSYSSYVLTINSVDGDSSKLGTTSPSIHGNYFAYRNNSS